MYEKGLIKQTSPPCETCDENGYCDLDYDDDHKHIIRDSRTGEHGIRRIVVYLPHSCDEWVIGGREEVKQLISDLEDILQRIPTSV